MTGHLAFSINPTVTPIAVADLREAVGWDRLDGDYPAALNGLRTQGRWVWELAVGDDDLPAADTAEPSIPTSGSELQILMPRM